MITGSEFITYLSNFPIAQSAISQISGALIAVMFMRKKTSTKEFEKLKAGEFKEVLHDLVTNGEISYKELYEANNYLAIAEKADKYYHKKKNDNYQNRDFDFFYRFYDNAGKVSDEEMQELWAKILAGEINQPGEYSLKTLLVLSSFSKTMETLVKREGWIARSVCNGMQTRNFSEQKNNRLLQVELENGRSFLQNDCQIWEAF